MATGSSLMPADFSGAPPSSTWMCAVSAQITAPQRGSMAWSPTTFAPVPLNIGHAVASLPKCWATTSWRRAVYTSSP